MLIFSASSSNVLADVQCFLSFKITIISAASIGIGSVGISPEPIFVTTFKTSGNLSNNIFAVFWVDSIVVLNDEPGNNLASTAKSPSSNLGINSPPIFNNTTNDIPKNTNAVAITVLGKLKTLFRIGLYQVCNF